MDLTLSPEDEAFRAEARAWLEANVPHGLPSGDTKEGFELHKAWEKKLFDARFAVVSWPREYGGREASLTQWLIFEEEYYRAGGPQRITQNGIFLLAPTLFEFGTDEQKSRILPRMAAAEDLWAQGWSEPGAGSDLAGVRCVAERDEAAGGYRLSGQKTWCTRGAFCDFLFGIFRSDKTAERHKGLTYLLAPLHGEGVTVRPVGRLDGDDGFAEVFYDGAFVPDRDIIGKPNEGWSVAMATASSERGLTLRSPGRFLAAADRLTDLYKKTEHPDTASRDAVTKAWIDAQSYQLFTQWTVSHLAAGARMGAEASLMKVFWSEMDIRLHEAALSLLGPLGELAPEAPGAAFGGAWMKGLQFALAGPIYAGTNEIQRNVIAERLLGLPRK
jgi:hypothetical protein